MNIRKNILFFLYAINISSCTLATDKQVLNLTITNTQETPSKLSQKLIKYNLVNTNKVFKYSYKTEIFSPNLKESFSLDPQIEGFAQAQYLRLNHSIFFDPDFLIQTKEVRNYHLKPKYFKHNVGELLTVLTRDGYKIPCTFFDRNSDKLLVVGEGFTNQREIVSPFIDMFPHHDIVIFDYRGHGLSSKKTNFSLTKYLFGADCYKAKMGAEEELDVFAVVDSLKRIKQYKQINGLGICYSALIFAKAEAIRQKESNEQLFNHLILDGCWLSLENFVEKIIKDPKRICSPQYGGWKNSWPIHTRWFQKCLTSLGQELFHTKFNQVSILDYLPYIKDTSILYFYGKNDLVISRHEFKIIWNATKIKNKTAIVTSNPHVRNHLKEKEIYTLICDLFLDLPHNQFISCLKDKEYLLNYQANKLKYEY